MHLSERIKVLLIIFGPGASGLLALLIVSIVTRSFLFITITAFISAALQFVTFLLIYTVAYLGWGDQSAFLWPWKALLIGLGATVLIAITKIAFLVRHASNAAPR
jgi:hypothetical protein